MENEPMKITITVDEVGVKVSREGIKNIAEILGLLEIAKSVVLQPTQEDGVDSGDLR